ncbi:MAG: hypothetical protein ACK4R3_01415 [Aliihoeflea sp.]|uniref:hypothetical protein n=1 Tax=Aliihoeflea sp. 40Bstr573 TaxID=2696467 RepID=UPI0020961812|nr:hypothetical protein [Aliihoeflea sp. 40Bstr573]MCO6387047.1 hypothetical protein [Aliihoeflea sp. 40Bstr573]
MTRLKLLERLKTLQQMPPHVKRDITTVSAMLSTEALARHVELCEIAAGVPPMADGRAESGPVRASLRA